MLLFLGAVSGAGRSVCDVHPGVVVCWGEPGTAATDSRTPPGSARPTLPLRVAPASGDDEAPVPSGTGASQGEEGQAAWRTNCTSRLMVTSLPSVKPPASSAAFQFTPNSLRSIFVVASAPSLVWP